MSNELSGKQSNKVNTDWKERLRPFGSMFVEMSMNIANKLNEYSDEELEEIIDATYKTSPTNIGWGEYHVSEEVRTQAQWIIYRRQKNNP